MNWGVRTISCQAYWRGTGVVPVEAAALEVVPVAWASVLNLMRGQALPEYLPPYWVEFFMNLVGREPLSPPDMEINVGEQTRIRITAELDKTLQGLKEKVDKIYRIF